MQYLILLSNVAPNHLILKCSATVFVTKEALLMLDTFESLLNMSINGQLKALKLPLFDNEKKAHLLLECLVLLYKQNIFHLQKMSTYGSDRFLLASTAARSLHCLMERSRLQE